MSELANDASDAQDDVHPSPGTAGGNGKNARMDKGTCHAAGDRDRDHNRGLLR